MKKNISDKPIYVGADITFKDFGIFLKHLRRAEHLSKLELARRAETTARTIYNIENGSHIPRVPILARIAWVYDMNILDLFTASELYYESLATN